jgi:predicted outer membrane repeat protein
MKRLIKFSLVAGVICLFAGTAFGDILNVPTAEYPTIQDAINAASSGDTVQVASGTYDETIIMKSGVVIQGAGQDLSTIDGSGSDTVVYAFNVDSSAKLEGFTITGGIALYGGGMSIFNSNPIVTNCTFSGNLATAAGGAIYNNNYSSPTFINCIFSGNSAQTGGGIDNRGGASPTFVNCTFSENSASYGGGISIDSAGSTVINSTFSQNIASNGGAIYSLGSLLTVINSILWGNSTDEIFSNSAPLITYSDIQGGFTGTGNIDIDPKFEDPLKGDFHLQQYSPCIDAGDNSAPSLPLTDIDGDNRKIDHPGVVDTGSGTPPIVDMGVDEFKISSCNFFIIPNQSEGAAVICL